MGKVHIIHPEGQPQEVLARDECPTLEELQRWVGGYILAVTLRNFNGLRAQMIVNEDGTLMQLPVNDVATKLYGTVIVGTVVVLEGLRLP